MLIDKIPSLPVWAMDIVHQNLWKIVNNLYDATMANDTKAIDEKFKELVDDFVAHFFFEEDLMQKYDYPKYTEHKSIHTIMFDQITWKYESWLKNRDVKELQQYLEDDFVEPLIDHIDTIDRELSTFLVDNWVA